MLRDAGFDVRVTIQHLDIFPEGVGVLKHIPFAPLYAEELMVQVLLTVYLRLAASPPTTSKRRCFV